MVKIDKLQQNQTFTGAGKLVVSDKNLMQNVQRALIEFAEENKFLLGDDNIYGLLNRNNLTDMFILSHDDARGVKNAGRKYIDKLAAAIKLKPQEYLITAENLNNLPQIIRNIVSK